MTRARLPLVLIAAAGVALALAAGRFAPGAPTHLLDRALTDVKSAGRWGAALFVVLQIAIAVSGLLPASLLGMAAGAIYGVWAGFAIAAGGTLAGAWIAFRLARSLLRGPVERLLADRPRLRALDARLGQETWKLVCLLRASPVMPFAVTSYTLGLSAVPTGAYMVGSLAALPALFGYVVLGSIAEAGLAAEQAGAGPFRWALLAIGGVAMTLLVARVGRLIGSTIAEPQDGLLPDRGC